MLDNWKTSEANVETSQAKFVANLSYDFVLRHI